MRIAFRDIAEEGEKLFEAERFFRTDAKVPLVMRQTSPPRCLSIGLV
jgi:hypothetical protein